MAIENLEQLSSATKQASELLQEIQNYCELNNINRVECEESKVRFPRGFIRTAVFQRNRFGFISSRPLKSNLSYTLILSDVLLWLILRTDLWGTPKEMIVKLNVFLIGTLCESMTKDYLAEICGHGFKKRNEFLVENKIISDQLRTELDWIWDTRNKMHLFQLEEAEYQNEYNDKCHKRCVTAFRELIQKLQDKGRLE